MARTYVPGYGYVDSEDPGTRGTVKPGKKRFSSGQEPRPAISIPPVSPYPPEDALLVADNPISVEFSNPAPRTSGLNDGTLPGNLEDRVVGVLSGNLPQDDDGSQTFGNAQFAQTVAEQRNGYVVEESPGVFKVVYGAYALQAQMRDDAERRKAENRTRDREGGVAFENAPGEDLTYYGSTTTGDTPITRARRDAQEYAFYTNQAQIPKDAGIMTADTFFSMRGKGEGPAFGVYMGTITTAGSVGATAVDIVKDSRIVEDYTMLSDEEQTRVINLVDRYYEGMPWTFSWIDNRWKDAVDRANKRLLLYGEKITPFEVFDRMIASERAKDDERRSTGGGGGFYGGGGFGGGGGGSATIRLTNATDARIILNQAMTQYLGRQSTAAEIDKFVKALNTQERAAPVTTLVDGDLVVQEGGFNPSTFAEDFARSMSGSTEYQAVTGLLNALIGELDGNTGVL